MWLKEDEEVSSLIKREIAARNFFLLRDSPAARNSHYVRLERRAAPRKSWCFTCAVGSI
jgi:hypothetical protein